MARDDIDLEPLRRLDGGLEGAEIAPLAREAATGPTTIQYGLSIGLLTALGAVFWANSLLALTILHAALLIAFASAVLWRSVATAIARPPRRIAKLDEAALAPYTVIVPLYHEAAMVPGLVAVLKSLDYPVHRLQILIVLEADDEETWRALNSAKLPDHFQIVIATAGFPKTKPRACNVALARANGRYVVVYDAEDRPHPLQLREAAARFDRGVGRLACLQAPLRIVGARGFLARQFALEYAAQFEIILPALRRLGAPFPLGGTSNHFSGIMQQMGQEWIALAA
jgi:cellulose synthase/poly-beta-1,6-N-acetylglucosamine synthase-like glycosyltransferase